MSEIKATLKNNKQRGEVAAVEWLTGGESREKYVETNTLGPDMPDNTVYLHMALTARLSEHRRHRDTRLHA